LPCLDHTLFVSSIVTLLHTSAHKFSHSGLILNLDLGLDISFLKSFEKYLLAVRGVACLNLFTDELYSLLSASSVTTSGSSDDLNCFLGHHNFHDAAELSKQVSLDGLLHFTLFLYNLLSVSM